MKGLVAERLMFVRQRTAAEFLRVAEIGRTRSDVELAERAAVDRSASGGSRLVQVAQNSPAVRFRSGMRRSLETNRPRTISQALSAQRLQPGYGPLFRQVR